MRATQPASNDTLLCYDSRLQQLSVARTELTGHEGREASAIQEEKSKTKPVAAETTALLLIKGAELDHGGFDISKLPPDLRRSIETIQQELDRVGLRELRAPLFCKAQDLLKTKRKFNQWLKSQPNWLKYQSPTSPSTVYRMIAELRGVDKTAAQVAKSYLQSKTTDAPSEWLRKVTTRAGKLIIDYVARGTTN